MRKILGALKRADDTFNLIEEGDNIAVGVSGGKDSLLLFQALHYYKKYSKKNFEIVGIHVNAGFPGDNIEPIVQWCKDGGYEFYTIDTLIYQILQKYLNKGRICCSRCSNLKKGTLVLEAKKLKCNKIALGHHQDDAIETIFLNMLYGGKCHSFPPKLFLSRQEVTMIRPFFFVAEKEIKKAVSDAELPVMKSCCPVDGDTKRTYIKKMLAQIYQQVPGSEKNLIAALMDLEQKDN